MVADRTVPGWLKDAVACETEKAKATAYLRLGRKSHTYDQQVAQALGVTVATVRRIRKGVCPSERKLAEMLTNYYRHSDALKVRVASIIGEHGTYSVLRKLQASAALVQGYGDILKPSQKVRQLYVFPPRRALRSLSLAIEEARDTLLAIHRSCPEFDDIVFAQAPELLACFIEAEKRNKPTDKS